MRGLFGFGGIGMAPFSRLQKWPDCRKSPRWPFLLLILFLSGSGFPQPSASTADFLIVENPRRLVIYNKYEQSIGFEEERHFLPFKPMRVIRWNTHLSDGFTPCTEVLLGDEVFYLLREESGGFRGEGQAGYLRRFRKCRVLSDTVEVRIDHTIFLSKRPTFSGAPETGRYFLPQGQRLRRWFQYREFTYVELLPGEQDFGWTHLPAEGRNRSWRRVRRMQGATPEISREVEQKVFRKLEEANQLLQRLFAHFNRRTGQHLLPPHWEMEVARNTIRCYLRGDAGEESFSESTRQLVRALENALLGSPVRVEQRNHTIVIQPRS